MKVEVSNRKIRYIVYAVFTAVLIYIAYWCMQIPDVSMRIIYTAGLDANTQNSIIYDMGDGYSDSQKVTEYFDTANTCTRRYFELFLPIPAEYQRPRAMKMVLQPNEKQEENNTIQIKCVELYNHNISMSKYSPMDLYNMFTFEGIKDVYVDRDRLCIVADGDEPSMVARDSFLQEYQTTFELNQFFYYNLAMMWVLLFMGAILLDFAILALYQKHKVIRDGSIINRETHKSAVDIMHLIMTLIIFAAGLCVAYMAFKSQHYAHPDEDVTRLAIDYYMGRWIPPDVRSRATMGTFSYFGSTRLDENTLYYLLAGKVGWFCATFLHISRYYRVFNVLLFIIMVGIFLVKGKKNPWMIIALGITPQLWYLFSYATSDAFDYFISFMVIYQFLIKDSMLNKLLEKRAKRPYVNVLLCGFLFSMLLRAKQNYYLILLFAFCILLQRWWKSERTDKIGLLQKYMLILMCTFLLFGIRIGVNYYYYGTYNTGSVGGEMGELNAADAYRPSVLAEKGISISQAGQGKSITDVFVTYGKDIVTGLIWSGVGNYGWLEYPHIRVYGYILFGLCGIAYLYIVFHMIKERKGEGILDSTVLTGFIGLAYFMVLYICWSSDFQTQGRYVLLLCPIVGYYSAKCSKIYQDKKFNLLLLVLCICSLYSYIGNALYHLT